MASQTVNWDDVQGLVLRGYGGLHYAKYILLKVSEAGKARAWISGLPIVPAGGDFKGSQALHIALTAQGMRNLGIPSECVDGFSMAFTEGLVTEHRTRLLGDTGPNDPTGWDWGSKVEMTPDLMLLAFAETPEILEQVIDGCSPEKTGCQMLRKLDGVLSPDNRDHFNFVDGVSQPLIKEAPKADQASRDDITVGEFLLGYADERSEMQVVPQMDVKGKSVPFGLNGSYLVFRQMEQDVPLFLETVKNADPQNPDRIGAKFVGRWPDGTPLAVSATGPTGVPGQDPTNEFDYTGDRFGLACPRGAHVRRANPRDDLRPVDSVDAGEVVASLRIVKHHRIMRRGRLYGPLYRAGGTAPLQAERGLQFICLNANIANQFELIQHSWVNNNKFGGLYDEVDPLVGMGDAADGSCPFSMPAQPVREKIESVKRMITVKGGAYFFLPGIAALKAIGEL